MLPSITFFCSHASLLRYYTLRSTGASSDQVQILQ